MGNMLAKLPKPLDQEQVMNALDAAFRAAVNGLPGQKSCEEIAAEYLERHRDVDVAVKKFTTNQANVCGASGFVTNLGGLPTMAVTLPANIASVAYVQLRMIAVIAAMGGYDVHDDAVQSLIYVCMVGMSVVDVMKDAGVSIGNKLSLNAIKRIPGEALIRINQKVGFRFLTKFGEKGVVNLGKMIPVVGGIIGGGVDLFGARIVAKRAYKMFILEDQ
ncbi:MAG: EcsC family protein [Clostridia bacterium]|nr:EcsC family protein [Clostridia bacterium]